jgi:transposase
MPELGQVSDEVAAALIGVAPYDDDSGKRRGERYRQKWNPGRHAMA